MSITGQIEEHHAQMSKGGGQAFPTPAHRLDDETAHLIGTPGISYLDYMAGQALAGMMADVGLNLSHPDKLASAAYGIADAMLAEKQRRDA